MSSSDAPDNILSLENISTNDETAVNLHNVNLAVQRGVIHAIVGNKGSGKSTLAAVLSGTIKKSQGKIIFDHSEIQKNSPSLAMELGILSINNQDDFYENLNAYQNIYLNREIRMLYFFSNRGLMIKRTTEALKQLHCEINPVTPLKYLNPIQQRKIQIAKMLCFTSRLLIINELSNKFKPEDVDTIHYLLSLLRLNGTTVVYLTSNIDDVYNFAGAVSFIKDGRIISTNTINEIDTLKMVELTYSSMMTRQKITKNNLELFYFNNLAKQIINSIPVALAVTNNEDDFIFTNRLFHKLFINVNYKSLNLSDLIEQGNPADFPSAKLERRFFPDVPNRIDPFKRFDIYVYPCLDDENSLLGSIYLLNDVAKRDDLREILRQEANEGASFDTLFKTMHEINNPLAIIANYLQIIKNSASIEDIHSSADVLQNEIGRIKRIISHAMENGGAEHQGDVVNISSVSYEIISLLHPRCVDTKKVIIVSEIDKTMRMSIDPDLLTQLFLNTCINSIESIDYEGKVTLRAAKTQLAGRAYMRLEVSDTGQGIRKEHEEKIFTPFFTTKTGKNNQGLGLSIIKDIVERLGGHIEFKSMHGKGTTFYMYIPQ